VEREFPIKNWNKTEANQQEERKQHKQLLVGAGVS